MAPQTELLEWREERSPRRVQTDTAGSREEIAFRARSPRRNTGRWWKKNPVSLELQRRARGYDQATLFQTGVRGLIPGVRIEKCRVFSFVVANPKKSGAVPRKAARRSRL